MVRLLAPAKLNLGLHVLGRRPDGDYGGYHEIETIFVPLRLYDELEIEFASEPGIRLDTDAPGLIDDERNLAVQAARATCTALDVEPQLRLTLRKRIPIAAGLGGGSSDAAAAILGVESLTGRSLTEGKRAALALRLGADVPFFLAPQPAIGRGIGERLEPIEDVPELAWILVRMPFGISTADAYAEAARELTLPRRGSSIAALLGPSGVVGSPRNDLEASAVRNHPEIGRVQQALADVGAKVTGMSGSGPTVYGHFDSASQARAAADRVELPEGAEALVTTSPASGSSNWAATGDGA